MDSFQRKTTKSRVSITLDLHTGGAQKKIELPLKLLVAGDFSAGREQSLLSERKKVNINKKNFDAVLADYAPDLKFATENTLSNDGSELPVNLSFRSIKDFEPEQVARQIPELQALLAVRNLLRDLKSNLLDNATFRREFEKILKNKELSDKLRGELSQIATAATQPEGHA